MFFCCWKKVLNRFRRGLKNTLSPCSSPHQNLLQKRWKLRLFSNPPASVQGISISSCKGPEFTANVSSFHQSPHLSFEGLDDYFNSAICSGIVARGARQSYAPRVGPSFELAGKFPSPVAMDATDVETIHAKPEEHVHCGSCHLPCGLGDHRRGQAEDLGVKATWLKFFFSIFRL